MTTAVFATVAGVAPLDGKRLMDERLWSRLVARIATEYGVDVSYSERILDQAVAFLRLCAARPNQSFAPSPIVDVGWHAFILTTREYAEFCEKIAGRFIHHIPRDEEGADSPLTGVTDTVHALKELGLWVDEPLWFSSGKCNGSRCDGNQCRGKP